MWELDHKEGWTPKNWCFPNCGAGENSWQSTSFHWKECCWSSNTFTTWSEELTHWKRPWCWERLRAGGEGNDRGWDGWMASLTQWTWVWVDSGSWWWTGMPGVLGFMGSQRVRHVWATEQNWTVIIFLLFWGASIICHIMAALVYIPTRLHVDVSLQPWLWTGVLLVPRLI